jgi:uncharacterized integral membrane protein (TIGR00698 family)
VVPDLAGAVIVLGALVGAASVLALQVPAVSVVLWAMLLGALVAPLGRRSPAVTGAAQPVGRHLLRAGVALLGLRIAFGDLAALGVDGALIAAATVAITMLVTTAVGRRLGVERNLALLIATGTAVCGASAIAAMASALRPREQDVAYAIATVTLFGTLAMAILPLAGTRLLNLDDRTVGAWLGASIHEVAQVAGAGAAVSLVALQFATLIKLARVVLLAPAVAIAALVRNGARTGAPDAGRPPLVPGFVLVFIGLVAVRSALPVPAGVVDAATLASTILLAAGLASLGLQMDLRTLRPAGVRPLALGLLASVCTTGVALALVTVMRP